MKRVLIVAMVSVAFSTGTWAGTEGSSSTSYGLDAGAATDYSSDFSTFIGRSAGQFATGSLGVFVGKSAGQSVTTAAGNTIVGANAGQLATGAENTIVGAIAGMNAAGSGNVFLGFGAGYSEVGSRRLYIDNCTGGGNCTRPLVYGEFDNRLLAVDGVMHVTANRFLGSEKSQLHFSVSGGDVGGWMTSAADNNFFTSSGARYDANAGGWIQRSADGKAVISGSGAAGFRVLTSSGGAVGSAVVPVSRLHIDYAGLMGVNAAPVAGRAINTSTGAYLSSGGMWVNASSRALKRDIEQLSAEDAQQAFAKLKPVRFRYNADAGAHVGFIAEDVPELVATDDRKGLSSMEVVAVLTRVVQQQASQLEAMSERLRRLESRKRKE